MLNTVPMIPIHIREPLQIKFCREIYKLNFGGHIKKFDTRGLEVNSAYSDIANLSFIIINIAINVCRI